MSSLEERAAAAEAKLASLCERISKAEESMAAGAPPAAAAVSGDAPLKGFQLEMLGQLRQLRAKMVADDAGASAGGGPEVDALKADNAKLVAENKALNFRVVHLLRALDDAEKA